MKKKITLVTKSLMAMLVVAFYSCTYDLDTPVPTGVDVGVGFVLVDEDPGNENARMSDRLTVDEVTMQIKRLDVKVLGKAPQQTDIDRNLTYDFPQPINFVITTTEDGQEINVIIPEGIYRQFMFDLNVVGQNDLPAATASGTFINSSNEELPLKFELFGDSFNFEGKFEAKDKSEEMDFDKLSTALMLVEVRAKDWFSEIDEDLFDNAELVDGVLLINPETNVEIYNFIEAKIQEMSEFKIVVKLQQNNK